MEKENIAKNVIHLYELNRYEYILKWISSKKSVI